MDGGHTKRLINHSCYWEGKEGTLATHTVRAYSSPAVENRSKPCRYHCTAKTNIKSKFTNKHWKMVLSATRLSPNKLRYTNPKKEFLLVKLYPT